METKPSNVFLKDWRDAYTQRRLCFYLALEDLQDLYRRSYVGLAWIALTFLAFVGIKIVVFRLLNDAAGDFFAKYLTIGFALWTLINALVVDTSRCYIASRSWILSSALPYSVYLVQTVFRAFINFAFLSIAVTIILLMVGDWPSPDIWTIIPALMIYFVSGLWLGSLFAPICVRYRDFLYAIQTGMRIMFFATPIIWIPIDETILEVIALLNPLSHYIAIIRDPLMGSPAPVLSWAVASSITVVGITTAAVVYARTRSYVAFWV